MILLFLRKLLIVPNVWVDCGQLRRLLLVERGHEALTCHSGVVKIGKMAEDGRGDEVLTIDRD